MSDTTLQLGDVTFEGFEIPESLPFGGEQRLAIHRRVGGARTVDSMGEDPEPVMWSGRFRGAEALPRALALDAMRKAGKPVALTWGGLAFTVVIRVFRPDYQFAYEIPYSITCEVVTDDTQPLAPGGDVGIEEMMSGDALRVSTLTGALGNAGLSGAVTTMTTALGKVRDITNAGRAELNTVLAPLAAISSAATGVFNSAEALVAGAVSLGGVSPGFPPLAMASSLLSQVSAMTQAADSLDAVSFADRMTRNLLAVGSSGTRIVAAGADLFDLATRAYGDATEWATIARANGLTDPIVAGLAEILIPPSTSGAGGVLTL